MGYRLLPSAEAELDEIWFYAARASGSVEIANRVIEAIARTLLSLGQYPPVGRRRDMICGQDYAVFQQANM